MTIVPATTYVLMDEPCCSLTEVNLRRPDSRGYRRYRIVYVWRNGLLCEYREDVGPVTNAMCFRIPGAIYDDESERWDTVETVGSLVDIAEALRAGKVEQPHHEPTDLMGQWHEQLDKKQMAQRGRGLSIVV